MPEAGQRPDDEQVQDLMFPVAAERDVEVLPEERGQRDVPAPPEVCNAVGDVRVVEVLLVLEAEHAAEADGHVGVGGEIEVDLERVAQDAEPGAEDGQVREVSVEERGGDFTGDVREDSLLEQTHEKAQNTFPNLFSMQGPLADLRLDVHVFDDRSGDELREHADVEQQVAEVLLHRSLVPVDIDDVRDGLERVERDADGQRQFQKLRVRVEQSIEVEGEKV